MKAPLLYTHYLSCYYELFIYGELSIPYTTQK